MGSTIGVIFNCCHVYCDVADRVRRRKGVANNAKEKKFKWSYVYLFVVFALLYAPIFLFDFFIRLTTRKR